MAAACEGSASDTRARPDIVAGAAPSVSSRRTWAIASARIASALASEGGRAGSGAGKGVGAAARAARAGAAAGAAGAGGAAAAAAAAPALLPGKRTEVWHFGHFTLKARSGTRASSMTMAFAHLG